MNSSNTAVADKLDKLKWGVVVLLVGTGIVGFYYFTEYSLLLRVITLLALLAVATLTASRTEQGGNAINFVREAHIEVRKVVWPTRQETIQMTSIVLFMVVLVALIIWGLDSVLMWLVRLLTG
jgi:preprotein translocase subunit SecE